MSDGQVQWIVPTRGAKTLPVVEILTGRGVIFGKSGSGKSNSAGVIAEELLENNYSLLIVDPEGEYYGLKERYEILHVGNSDICDVQISPENAEQLAEIGLEQNMPIILDVSDYLDADEASALIANTVRALFQKEKEVRKPFLLMIEEMQEYLPQQGGTDELSELLERVAKRGRKRGLGMLGMSQRPSSVDKDFITQCDWMVWHRLTWKNDIEVVRNILGSDIADTVEDLDTGEGYLMTDWDESVERVQFKRKQTLDAGATPGLESYEGSGRTAVTHESVSEIESDADGGAVDESPSDASELPTDPPAAPDDPSAAPDGQTPLGEAVESVAIDEDDSSLESLEVDDLEVDVDLEAVSDDELRETAFALQRRNRVLLEEVDSLRTKLEDERRTATISTQTLPTDPRAERGPQSGRRTPTKPVPPDPPEQREGIAGNLVELVALTGYLIRSMLYRLRLVAYRARYPEEYRG